MMSGNELQFGLVGLGVLAIVGVLVFNFWQERRARIHAEQAFRSTHHDVLLDEKREHAVPPAPGGRMEPGLPGNEASAEQQGSARVSTVTRSLDDEAPAEEFILDCVVNIDAPAGVSASALFAAQFEIMSGFNDRLRWFGWMDVDHCWQVLDAHTPGSLNRARAVLQLVDRRGAISQNELDRFYQQLQRVCDQFLAVPRLPARAEILQRAAALDTFCADVDIQLAVNIVSDGSPFLGSKLRGIVESIGFELNRQGLYLMRDANGHLLFSLSNQEQTPFTPDQLRQLQTYGLVLTLDIPCTQDPAKSFDRMVTIARTLAERLGGKVVDDNRVPLSDRSLAMIRGQIAQFEQQMERQSIPAGSELAIRLFS